MTKEIEREQKSLKAIRAIVDAYRNGTITVTVENENVNANNHIYDLSVIMGMIQNHTYDGLGLPIPKKNKEERRTVL